MKRAMLKPVSNGLPAAQTAMVKAPSKPRRVRKAARKTVGPTGGATALAQTDPPAASPADIDWLWPRWLARGHLSLGCGAGQVGLTSVVLDLVASTTNGGPFPDQMNQIAQAPWRPPSKVLMFCDEHTLKTCQSRLAAADADCELVRCVPLELDLKGIERRLAAGDYGLVVLDALRIELWRDGALAGPSENLFRQLASLAERYARAGVPRPRAETGHRRARLVQRGPHHVRGPSR